MPRSDSHAGEGAPSGPELGRVVRELTRQLEVMRVAIRALEQDLESCRRENRELARERVQLLKRLSETEIARIECDDLRSQLAATLSEKRRLAESHRSLEARHEELEERHAEQDEELAAAREFAETAGAEIHVLEQQVENLAEIAKLALEQAGLS